MSEEQQQENGASGEVPEIELIIKVSLGIYLVGKAGVFGGFIYKLCFNSK